MGLTERIRKLEQAEKGNDQELPQGRRSLASFGPTVEASVITTLIDIGAIRVVQEQRDGTC